MTSRFRKTPRIAARLALAVVEALESRQLLSATLRIAAYNIDADTTDFSNQGPFLETVLEAIGNEHLNDNGVMNAQPLDVLGLEELQNGFGNASAPTLASIVSALNATYGTGTYAFDPTVDPTDGGGTGNGPSGLIYNTKTVKVISATPLGSVSGGGAARAPMQYELQPIGFGSAADFYVDVSHMKASSGVTNAARRNVEATTIVNSLGALGPNAHVISMGDFNITGDSSEQTYKTMRTKFDDPANPAGNWTSSSSFPNLLSESASDVEFRDDIQFVTPAADSGSSAPGLQLEQGSLTVFGNGGAASIYKNNVSNATANPGVFPDFTAAYRAAVLSALQLDTDHLPVVADYDIVGVNGISTPKIGALSVNPTTAVSGSTVNLTASNVMEAGGTISSVAFYLDTNGNPGLQIGSDTLVGAGVGAGDGTTWTLSTSTSGLPAGTYTYYAVATDAQSVNSNPASTTLTVSTPPPYVTFSSGATYTWNSTTGDLNLFSGTVTFTEDQAISGDTVDPLINLTASTAASTVVFNTDQHITGLTLSGGATASVLSGADAIVNMAALAINPGSTLDITTNTLAINFGPPANDPVAAIAADLTTGYNGGNWTGMGLTSSAAAANAARFAIGYADGNFDPGTGTSSNQILVKYTLVANANLDASVGFDDLVAIAQNFGFTGKDWAHGNFIYDPNGSVGFEDLVQVAQNFGQSMTAGAAQAGPINVAPIPLQAATGADSSPLVESTSSDAQMAGISSVDDGIDAILGRRRHHSPLD